MYDRTFRRKSEPEPSGSDFWFRPTEVLTDTFGLNFDHFWAILELITFENFLKCTDKGSDITSDKNAYQKIDECSEKLREKEILRRIFNFHEVPRFRRKVPMEPEPWPPEPSGFRRNLKNGGLVGHYLFGSLYDNSVISIQKFQGYFA